MLEKPPDDINDKCEQKAEEDHSGNGKIKPAVFSFYADITRESPYPVQLIMKKINDDPNHNNQYAKSDDIFSCLLFHYCKAQLKLSYFYLNDCYAKIKDRGNRNVCSRAGGYQ